MTNTPFDAADISRVTVGYVVGTSHCGSTVLAFLADTHPEIAAVGQAHPSRRRLRGDASGTMCGCGRPVGQCSYWASVFAVVQSRGVPLRADNWPNSYRYAHPLVHWLLTEWSEMPTLNAVRYALRLVNPAWHLRRSSANRANVELARAMLLHKRAKVFFDTSKDLFRLWCLLRVREFDVRAIHLMRDVRAFVASRQRRRLPAKSAACDWLGTQRAAIRLLATLPSEKVLRVRYGDLCRDPQGVMNNIFSHLGLDAADVPVEIDRSAHHVLGNTLRGQNVIRVQLVERWRGQLAEREISDALRVAGDMNEYFGYR
jgi:hypothetical protein